MRIPSLALALLALASTAWAQDSTPRKPGLKREANVISFEEIDAIRAQVSTAFDVVQRLRPQFLRARGANSFGNARDARTVPYARVVVDGLPRGDLDVLRQIPVMTVREIRYLGSADASIKFGTGYDGGAILVVTR